MIVSDEFINKLFTGTNFGAHINEDVNEKRKLIAKTLRNQIDGYWSGSTAYNIAIYGGFLHDAKSGRPKKLTALGDSFLAEQ